MFTSGSMENIYVLMDFWTPRVMFLTVCKLANRATVKTCIYVIRKYSIEWKNALLFGKDN